VIAELTQTEGFDAAAKPNRLSSAPIERSLGDKVNFDPKNVVFTKT
jgi:hypothetical protein